jgi:hypothetical protein
MCSDLNFQIELRSFAPSALASGLRPRRVLSFSEVAPPFQKSWLRPCGEVGIVVYQLTVFAMQL